MNIFPSFFTLDWDSYIFQAAIKSSSFLINFVKRILIYFLKTSNLPLFSLSQKLSHQNGITNPPNIKSCLKSPYFKSKHILFPESPFLPSPSCAYACTPACDPINFRRSAQSDPAHPRSLRFWFPPNPLPPINRHH